MAKVPRGEINQHGVDLGMIANNTRGLTNSDVDGLIEIRENNCEQIASAISSAIAKGLETIGLVAEGDHPRVCGEHYHHLKAQLHLQGSSPRVRGTSQSCTP